MLAFTLCAVLLSEMPPDESIDSRVAFWVEDGVRYRYASRWAKDRDAILPLDRQQVEEWLALGGTLSSNSIVGRLRRVTFKTPASPENERLVAKDKGFERQVDAVLTVVRYGGTVKIEADPGRIVYLSTSGAIGDYPALDRIPGSESRSDGFAMILEGLPHLRRLHYFGAGDDVVLRSISRLEDLEDLYLGGVFDEGAMRHLSALEKLRKLWVSTTVPGGGEGLRFLAGSNLERLVVDFSISDKGVAAISRIRSLRSLMFLRTFRVSDDGIDYLASLENLHTLEVSIGGRHTGALDDESIERLVRCKSLRRLRIPYSNATDECIDSLTRMPWLVEIQIALSNDAMERLRRRMPNTFVYFVFSKRPKPGPGEPK